MLYQVLVLQKILFIVGLLILLPGCGAKGDLYLAKPTSELKSEPSSQTDSQVTEPNDKSNDKAAKTLHLEQPSK